MKQHVRFLTTDDDVTLAWAQTGRGVPLVKAANWLTHLEYDWQSPVWKHWTNFFARHFQYVRYDERGCGMTDREVGDLSFPRWVDDLEAVTNAAGFDRPFVLVGISQGAATAVAYAVRHPERVSHLVLYGGYARGANRRDDKEWERLYAAMEELAGLGWEKDNPIFRQVFTSRFIPEGTEEQIGWFNTLCRRTTTAENGAKLLAVRANVEASDLLQEVAVPTLVIHADRDEVVPLEEGKRLASGIPDATFVQLQSRNHILLEDEPAWRDFRQAVLDFTGLVSSTDGNAAGRLAELSQREREILALAGEGLTNGRIAWRLRISEKTVRNHVSSLYRKLGINSRAEAIVLARDYLRGV